MNEAYDVQGWGPCGSDDTDPYRPNFARSAASTFEFGGRTVVAIPGQVYDCSVGGYPEQYYTPFVFETNHERFKDLDEGIDWTQVPTSGLGPVYSEDYDLFQMIAPTSRLRTWMETGSRS